MTARRRANRENTGCVGGQSSSAAFAVAVEFRECCSADSTEENKSCMSSKSRSKSKAAGEGTVPLHADCCHAFLHHSRGSYKLNT